MAEIRVQEKSASHWWAWLIGLLVLAAVIWFLFGAFHKDESAGREAALPATSAPEASTAPETTTRSATAPATTPPATDVANNTAAPGTEASGSTAAPVDTAVSGNTSAPATANANGNANSTGGPITDQGAYGASGDKLSLVGRQAQFSDARVVRIVGPKTFTIASGKEELYVMLDDKLDQGVGSQGKIDKGSVLKLTGSFRRFTPQEIKEIAGRRIRGLTPEEREFLSHRHVYLDATRVDKIS